MTEVLFRISAGMLGTEKFFVVLQRYFRKISEYCFHYITTLSFLIISDSSSISSSSIYIIIRDVDREVTKNIKYIMPSVN